MSTVAPNNAPQIGDPSSSKQTAPKNIIKSTYETVQAALKANKKLILITGDVAKGKTALLHTISNDIAAKNRIIALSGKDLPSLEESKDGKSELNNMKDYILESSDLNDKLVVIIDDAYYLPLSFLGELIEHAKLSTLKNYNLQLILSGPLNFKDQLLAIEQINPEDLTHCPMDSLNEEEIKTYIKNKSYSISSNIKRVEIQAEALKELADFIQSDKQVLDVILEWCSAIVKKEQLPSMNPNTVNRATSYAQQFSKDKSLCLSNSYPPSHEVYKYINDIQSAKKYAEKSTAVVTKKSVNKKNKSTKKFIETSNKAVAHETKIPTITTEVKDSKKDAPPSSLDPSISHRPHAIEDEVMPIQWTSSSKNKSANKLFSPTITVLMILLLLSFGAFIAYRIVSDRNVWPDLEELFKQQIALFKSEQAIVENQEEPEVMNSKTVNAVNRESQKIEETAPKPHTEITASNITKTTEITTQAKNTALDTKKNFTNNEYASDEAESAKMDGPKLEPLPNFNSLPPIEEDSVGAATITLNDQNKIPDKIPDEKPADNEQEKILAPQGNQSTKETPSPIVEINSLLVLAQYQFENKKLTTPAGDNAFETYQKILAKYPNNEEAIRGIKKVNEKYSNWATYYHKKNEFKRAKYFYKKALDVDPNDNLAKAKLQNIAQQEAASKAKLAGKTNTLVLQEPPAPKSIQELLDTADQNMQQIEIDIEANNRSYKLYQETQVAYQAVLRSQPKNQQAIQGLFIIKRYYADWAEQQTQSKNYNIALFLYGQALSLDPGDEQIIQRLNQVRELKKAL